MNASTNLFYFAFKMRLIPHRIRNPHPGPLPLGKGEGASIARLKPPRWSHLEGSLELVRVPMKTSDVIAAILLGTSCAMSTALAAEANVEEQVVGPVVES